MDRPLGQQKEIVNSTVSSPDRSFPLAARFIPCGGPACVSSSLKLINGLFSAPSCLTDVVGVALWHGWHPVEIWPPQGLILVLLLQPINDRFKVFHQRVGVHLVGSDGFLQHLRPDLGGASLKDFPRRGTTGCVTPTRSHTHALRCSVNDSSGHSLHNCPCFLGAVDVTSVEGPGVVGFLAQLLVKLELQNEADEISARK